MSDLAETVERIFADHAPDKVRLAAEAGTWPDALWRACIDAGLHLALVDRGDAALGLSVPDAFGIVKRAGAHAVPIPLVETMLANWLLARAGLPPRDVPTVLAFRGGSETPWGDRAVVIQRLGDGFAVHEAGTCVVERATPTIANEPRVDLKFPTAGGAATPYPAGIAGPDALTVAEAALRTAQIAGAVDWITRACVDYANTRVQFGKPIGKFQAVQHSVAVLASQAAATAAAADMAADGFANGLAVDTIAAAKCFASEAAGIAAGLAHQIHGAIGFSREHGLHHRTRRLWSWRDEAGNDAYWARHLGGTLAGQSREDLWAGITRL